MLEPATTPARCLHLRLHSLGTVQVDDPAVLSLRAEDASGSFGLWPGHADFLTVLVLGVVSWRSAAAPQHWQHCATRGGVLTVRCGVVDLSTREAVRGDSLEALEQQVLGQLRRHQQAEDQARRDSRTLEARTLQQMLRYLRPAATLPRT